MRDPARIGRVLEKLRALWLSKPDLRFGQLVKNLVGYDENGENAEIFYLEDDLVEERITEVLTTGHF